jgi:hypothetical protein
LAQQVIEALDAYGNFHFAVAAAFCLNGRES